MGEGCLTSGYTWRDKGGQIYFLEQGVMVDSNQPTDDLVHELYARFGLAYYHSEVLHRGLCIILAMSVLPRRDMITRPRVEERLAQAFSLTFGEVIRDLSGRMPEQYAAQLEKAQDVRNFLAHHFWFDRAHLMFSADDIHTLIAELDGYTQMFEKLDAETSQWFEGRRREFGITPDVLQKSLEEILSGESEEPLPNKEAVRELNGKLKRRQHLIRVWEYTMPEGGKPLIFETEGGSLWQLCDVGLGWTRFTQVQPSWVECPDVKQHLPADIDPRPKDAKPWEYEFLLRNGAVLWVKPGRRERTFHWGMRTKRRGSEKGTG